MTNEDQFENITRCLGKNISKKQQQSQDGKELFCKSKKVLIKIYKIYHIYCLANCLTNLIPEL